MPHNIGKRWTPQDDALLRKLLEAGTSALLVAARLKRSRVTVRGRANFLGISVSRRKAKK
jgi:hypothetical protein